MQRKSYVLEIILAFLLLDFLNFYFFKNDMGFLHTPLHPYWLIVLFIPTRYGFTSGFMAGVIAGIHVVLFSLGHFPLRMDIEKIAEAHGLDLPVAFVLTGLFLGAVRQKYKDSEEQKERELKESREILEDLKKTAETTERARRVLEGRIVGETTTVRTLYEAAKKFDSLDLQSVYQGCLNILVGHLKVEKASLYIKDGEYLILKSSYGWTQGKASAGKLAFKDSIMSIAFEKKEIVTIKDILKRQDAKKHEAQYEEILAMIPFLNSVNEIVGVVNIEKLDFFQFNKPNLELMQIIIDWASRAIDNKLAYEKMKSQLIFDEQEEIYSNNYFKTALEKEFIKAKEHHLKLAVGFIKLEHFGFLEERVKTLVSRRVVAYLKKVASSSDLIFHYKFEGTYAVLSPLKDQVVLQATFKEFEKTYKQATDGIILPELILSTGELGGKIEDPLTWINIVLKNCRMPSF